MDLLKEEKRLTERKHKALENLERKQKYLKGAVTSFKKARRELKVANVQLRTIRQQIRAQGLEDLTVPEVTVNVSESVEEESTD